MDIIITNCEILIEFIILLFFVFIFHYGNTYFRT